MKLTICGWLPNCFINSISINKLFFSWLSCKSRRIENYIIYQSHWNRRTCVIYVYSQCDALRNVCVTIMLYYIPPLISLSYMHILFVKSQQCLICSRLSHVYRYNEYAFVELRHIEPVKCFQILIVLRFVVFPIIKNNL